MTSTAYTNVAPPPSLDKVWNRLHATNRLAEEVKHAGREAAYKFSILLVQFDGLSRMIFRLGHAPADDVWQRVLGALVHDLRAGDLCCRLGGDEFLLILPSVDQSVCGDLVDRLHQRWNPAPGTREATIELNIGPATYPAHGSTTEGLLAAADQAMNTDRLRNDLTRSPLGFSDNPAMAA